MKWYDSADLAASLVFGAFGLLIILGIAWGVITQYIDTGCWSL